ncbi:MAG: helix-turn-helix transcriptional regulator [Oscillospiraceae bacterium]|nr:helix-turn-helix transcriptional regulator [Oscillospiraceae bacterium]
MNLTSKIISLRKQHGMTQEELAERLNVSRQAISRWETGTAMPDAMNILALSRLFGVTTDYLLYDDYESNRNLPAAKSVQDKHHRLILLFLAMLEIAALVLQYIALIIRKVSIYVSASYLPILIIICGFELSWWLKRNYSKEALAFRRRFYIMTTWLGIYFPIRLIMMRLTHYYPWDFYHPASECSIGVVYLAAATFLSLWLNRKGPET